MIRSRLENRFPALHRGSSHARRFIHAALFLAGSGLVACNPIYYSPSTHNIPLLEGKGDLAGAVAVQSDRIEAQAAYALSDYLAVQFNGGFLSPDDLENGDGGSGHFLELGLGYFSPIGPRNLTWEIHGLVGHGAFENHFPSTLTASPGSTGELEGNMFRLGILPVLGYRAPFVEAAVSSRIAMLGYTGVTGSLVFEGEDQASLLRRDGRYYLLEPALTLRAGMDWVKFQLQAGYSFNITDPNFRQDDSMVTVGVFLRAPRAR